LPIKVFSIIIGLIWLASFNFLRSIFRTNALKEGPLKLFARLLPSNAVYLSPI
jgi:dolichol kinase